MEQPRAVKAALTPRLRQEQIHLDGFDYSPEELRGIRKVVITTCGSAYYAGCAGKYAAEKLKLVSEEGYQRLLSELQGLPKQMQQVLDMNTAIPRLAEKYQHSTSVFFIGRNIDYSVVLEGALKFKEISYIHAEAYAAGELKHGTVALIDEGQPMVALCCSEMIAEKTIINIIEVKVREPEFLLWRKRETGPFCFRQMM